jgi:hypothetical protein
MMGEGIVREGGEWGDGGEGGEGQVKEDAGDGAMEGGGLTQEALF